MLVCENSSDWCFRMKLDVGCGHNSQGDVNVDLFVEPTSHRSHDQRSRIDKALNVKSIPNFVRADACHLPFRNGAFDEVISLNVLEHIKNPVKMMREIVRVLKLGGTTQIHTSHWLEPRKMKPMHLHYFSKTTLNNLLKLCGLHVTRSSYVRWKFFPHHFCPIVRFPQGIEIVGRKIFQEN